MLDESADYAAMVEEKCGAGAYYFNPSAAKIYKSHLHWITNDEKKKLRACVHVDVGGGGRKGSGGKGGFGYDKNDRRTAVNPNYLACQAGVLRHYRDKPTPWEQSVKKGETEWISYHHLDQQSKLNYTKAKVLSRLIEDKYGIQQARRWYPPNIKKKYPPLNPPQPTPKELWDNPKKPETFTVVPVLKYTVTPKEYAIALGVTDLPRSRKGAGSGKV